MRRGNVKSVLKETLLPVYKQFQCDLRFVLRSPNPAKTSVLIYLNESLQSLTIQNLKYQTKEIL